MKEFIRKFVSLLLKVYSYRLHHMIVKKKNFIYSCWLQNAFDMVGKNTRFICPIYTCGGKRIKIGENCLFFRFCEINAWEKYKGYFYDAHIVIGDNCQFGPYTHITCSKQIVIGNGVLTGSNVLISDNNHGSLNKEYLEIEPKMRELTVKGPVIIGNNVWIGDKVSVLSGVHIGDNSIVAANSVVTHDIPANSVAAGVPAKVIRTI